MADELSEKCAKLQILNEEEEIIDIGEENINNSDDKLALRLVGQLYTVRPFNVEAFKKTMTQVWGLAGNLLIRPLSTNKFLFQFFHWKDVEKVLNGRPWCFDQWLLALQEMPKDIQPSDISIKFSPFWVRILNLPFGYRSEQQIKALASSIGEVLEVEDDMLDIEAFRRVRVLLDISKPLRRFIKVRTHGDTVVTLSLKYERLPYFYFLCGFLNHTDRDYTNVSEEDRDGGSKWTLELKASPRRGLNKQREEVMALKARKQISFVTKPPGQDKGSSEQEKGNQTAIIRKEHPSLTNVVEATHGTAPSKTPELPISSEAPHNDRSPVEFGPHHKQLGEHVEVNEEQHVQQFTGALAEFTIGSSKDTGRRKLAIRRKGTSVKIKAGTSPQTVESGNGTKGETGKRKMGDDDIDMIDVELDGKRSRHVEMPKGDQSSQVAEVGLDQPREQPSIFSAGTANGWATP